MIDVRHVYEFCQRMSHDFSAGFNQNSTPKGLKIMGEYPTSSGQVLSILFTVRETKVETKIFDASKRLIFNKVTTKNINYDTRLIEFLQRSVHSH